MLVEHRVKMYVKYWHWFSWFLNHLSFRWLSRTSLPEISLGENKKFNLTAAQRYTVQPLGCNTVSCEVHSKQIDFIQVTALRGFHSSQKQFINEFQLPCFYTAYIDFTEWDYIRKHLHLELIIDVSIGYTNSFSIHVFNRKLVMWKTGLAVLRWTWGLLPQHWSMCTRVSFSLIHHKHHGGMFITLE